METKRISYIDMAKGFGILLVVWGHSDFRSTTATEWIYSFHMPLFFILSGMLLCHTNATAQEAGTFIKKKLKSILIPYWIFSALSIVFSGILEPQTFLNYLPDALLKTFSLYGISVLWFLPALCFGEIIAFLICKHTKPWVSAILLGLIGCLAVFIANTYHYHYILDFNSIGSVLGAYLIAVIVKTGIAVAFLNIGYFSYALFFKKKHAKRLYLLLMGVFLMLSFYFAFRNGPVDLGNLMFYDYGLYFAAAFCGSMFLICLCKLLPTIDTLAAIGKNSLIIMVTHLNCPVLGTSYAIGRLALSFLPFLGEIGYMIVVIISLAIIEAIAIYIFNHYLPFLIGRTKKVTS